MNKEELKTLVKKYFNLTENNTPEVNNEEVKEESFATAKLVDGTEITNMSDGEFEVGQELHVITAEGQHVLAPSGEHTTESGITLTVDGEGKITGVARPDEGGEGSLAEDELPATEAMSAEETVEEEEKTEMAEDEIIEETLEEGGIKEEIIEAIMETVAPEIEALKAKLAEHDEKLKEYMSEPASEPTEQVAAKFSATRTSKDKVWEKEPFNQKQAQYDMIMRAKEKQSKTIKNN